MWYIYQAPFSLSLGLRVLPIRWFSRSNIDQMFVVNKKAVKKSGGNFIALMGQWCDEIDGEERERESTVFLFSPSSLFIKAIGLTSCFVKKKYFSPIKST